MKNRTQLRSCAITLFCAASFIAGSSFGQAPAPILPADLKWVNTPFPGVQASWALGAEKDPAAYGLRVKMAPGSKIMPHTHPDARNSTVLMGTIYVGFGPTFDEAKVVAIPTGGMYVAPAGVPHYVWAKEGEAMYQEAGVGPTGTVPVAAPK